MKYILILIFTFGLNLAFSQDEDDESAAKKISIEEINTFLSTIKEKEVKEQLIGSKQFESCKTSESSTPNPNQQEATRKCMAEVIRNFDDKQLEALESSLNIGIFDKSKSETTKSMKDYLNDRLSEAIYGEKEAANKKLKKLKDRKIADHLVFYELYKEQLGKNTMLYVSQYCFENFGFGDSKNIVLGQDIVVPAIKVDPADNTKYTPIDFQGDYKSSFKSPPGGIWKNHDELLELEVCSHEDITKCDSKSKVDPYKKFRTVGMLEQIKVAEFKLGKLSESETIKNRYGFCAIQVLKNMCELYKCNNTYTINNPNKEYCDETFGISVKRSSPIDDEAKLAGDTKSNIYARKRGNIACGVLKELNNYRDMLQITKDKKNELANEFKNNPNKGFSDLLAASSKGVYTGADDGKTTDELTMISAKELTEKVKEIAGTEETAKQLRDNCMDEIKEGEYKLKSTAKNDENCIDLMASLDKQSISAIEIDAEGKAELYLEKVNKLTSDDEIRKFIEDEKLDSIINHKDFKTLKYEELKEMVTEVYRTQKTAQLDAIKQKFMNQARLDEKSTEADKTKVKEEIAQESLADIEQHKKRIETLFQYSNVVSAYLEMEDDKGEVVGSNTTGRTLESDNSLNSETEQYTSYFGEDTGSGNNNATGFQYIEFLDTILSGENKTGKKNNP